MPPFLYQRSLIEGVARGGSARAGWSRATRSWVKAILHFGRVCDLVECKASGMPCASPPIYRGLASDSSRLVKRVPGHLFRLGRGPEVQIQASGAACAELEQAAASLQWRDALHISAPVVLLREDHFAAHAGLVEAS